MQAEMRCSTIKSDFYVLSNVFRKENFLTLFPNIQKFFLTFCFRLPVCQISSENVCRSFSKAVTDSKKDNFSTDDREQSHTSVSQFPSNSDKVLTL